MKNKMKEVLSGDNFVVPLEDNTYASAQVISYEPDAMRSLLCAFSSCRHEEIPSCLGTPSDDEVISIMFVTRDLIDSGKWIIVNNTKPLNAKKYLNIEKLRKEGFVGVEITGSFNAWKFLNAYHKLIPWNSFFDPKYLDTLLVSPDRKPENVLLK